MGLQSWPPSKPELSSMACLDVESPICRGKFKSVLQHCLQQRRTREQLVEQGIMPSLKSPVAFHKQIRSLQRARTGNILKHKLCSRPKPSELVRMHILEETQVEPSLQATQMRLKRARLADDLNEKIAQRPGPMELVEKKILPVNCGVEEPMNNGKADYSATPDVPDVYSFDEDSNDALSPQQPDSHPSPSQSLSSPKEAGNCDSSPPPQLSPTRYPQSSSDVSPSEKPSGLEAHQPNSAVIQGISSSPVLVKQTLAKLSTDKSRSKKSKEPKPRVRKLKYHQYIPPDQKQELSEAPMDSSYARLLQQQQQFLQLQILSLQQQKYNCQAVVPVTLKYGASQRISTSQIQTSCSALVLRGSSPSTPVQFHHTNTKSENLPANIDEMKVAELKLELKLRSLPVSGTKTDLIERLKLFHESAKGQGVAAKESGVAPAKSQSESINVTPPVSLIASKVSKLGIQDSSMKDTQATSISETLSNAALGTSASKESPRREGPTDAKVDEKDSEKDKRLQEKERQIEELMRKLEQEQRLVEELKMLLEAEKQSQLSDSPPHLSSPVPIQIKEENRSLSNCSASCSSPDLHVQVKREAPADHSHATSPDQFISGHRANTKAESLQPVQVLLPTSPPGSVVPAELPAKSLKSHTTVNSTAPGHIQASGHEPEKPTALQQQSSTHTQHLTKRWRMDNKVQSSPSAFLVSGSDNPSSHQAPPDALKEKGPTAVSQQMDDLFDVLIESGEISPFIRQHPPSMEKPLRATASVTTLPINTVLTRPPPLVQVAQPPGAPLSSPGNNLETLLDDTEAQRLKLLEELHSPLVSMLMPPSGVNLQSTSVDSMDWLDLTISVPAEGINPLDMSGPGSVFSSDFLDSHELHLNWD